LRCCHSFGWPLNLDELVGTIWIDNQEVRFEGGLPYRRGLSFGVYELGLTLAGPVDVQEQRMLAYDFVKDCFDIIRLQQKRRAPIAARSRSRRFE
jgi:hypothetical protein